MISKISYHPNDVISVDVSDIDVDLLVKHTENLSSADIVHMFKYVVAEYNDRFYVHLLWNFTSGILLDQSYVRDMLLFRQKLSNKTVFFL